MRRKGNRHQPGSAHGPRGSQGHLGIPPGYPRRWLRFGTFFNGVPAPKHWLTDPRCQNSGFLRSGGTQGSTGLERCGSGVPNGPFGWPHSRFGRGRCFYLGGRACNQENKFEALRQVTRGHVQRLVARAAIMWWRSAVQMPRTAAS